MKSQHLHRAGKTDRLLHRPDPIPAGEGHVRHRCGRHCGDWHTYAAWAAEAGPHHDGGHYSSLALDEMWLSARIEAAAMETLVLPVRAA